MALAHADVNIPLEWVHGYQPVYVFVAGTLVMAAGEFPEVIDADVREAMEMLIRTFRAAESGLVLEGADGNPIAKRLAEVFHERRADLDKSLARENSAGLRDADLMKMLIFLERYLDALSTGRPKGRAFTDHIRLDMGLPVPKAGEVKSSLIL